MSNVQWRISNDLYKEGNTNLALKYSCRSLDLCQEIKHDTGIVLNMYLISTIKKDHGDVFFGLKYLEATAKMAKKLA